MEDTERISPESLTTLGPPVRRAQVVRPRTESLVRRKTNYGNLARIAFFFRIQQLGKARVFLKEVEVLIVAGVESVGGAKLDGNF